MTKCHVTSEIFNFFLIMVRIMKNSVNHYWSSVFCTLLCTVDFIMTKATSGGNSWQHNCDHLQLTGLNLGQNAFCVLITLKKLKMGYFWLCRGMGNQRVLPKTFRTKNLFPPIGQNPSLCPQGCPDGIVWVEPSCHISILPRHY